MSDFCINCRFYVGNRRCGCMDTPVHDYVENVKPCDKTNSGGNCKWYDAWEKTAQAQPNNENNRRKNMSDTIRCIMKVLVLFPMLIVGFPFVYFIGWCIYGHSDTMETLTDVFREVWQEERDG